MCFLLGPHKQGTAVCLEWGILCCGTWGRCCCPQAPSVYRGCSAPVLHRGTFTNTNSINKHDLARLAVKTRSSHFPGPVSYFPVITRVSRNFQVSILSFPSTPTLPPSQISESCWLYFYLFSAALQVGDANPCSC